MGEESQHQDTRPRLEKVFEDGQICAENRRHLVRFINMSLQELWTLAYSEGYKDGQQAGR